MTLADDLKQVAFDARGIAGTLGFRPYTFFIRIEHYAGQHVGEEPIGVERHQILEANGQSPRYRTLTDEEITVGALPAGTAEIGPYTPEFAGVGTSDELITGKLPANSTRYIEVHGPPFPDGAKLEIQKFDADRPLRRVLRIANPKPL